MSGNLSTLILTGASGFVGSNFLLAAQDRWRIYAIARRSQRRSGIPPHPNTTWIQADIGNEKAVRRVFSQIEREGGANTVIHLAAYYDFSNEQRPEFQQTNVDGTRHLLEQSRAIGIKHFLFASSIAACEVPPPGEAITESSPADARFPYAISKRAGEEMMSEYAQWFRCSVVRLAAVFSEWCEYPPLYIFLKTWVSESWNARILGGKGRSAVPYIHTRDVNRILLRLIALEDSLPRLGVYIASPDGATSHRQLFDRATHFHFGRPVKPLLMPKPLATLGVSALDMLGRLLGRRPFERPWMMEYLDRPLTVDASRTRKSLDWAPTPRLHILRRVLFMIERMKTESEEWTARNQRAMKAPRKRPALVISDAMLEAGDAIVDAIVAYLQSPVRHDRFPRYADMSYEELRWHVGIVYQLLMAAVRTGDRAILLQYIHALARRRHEAGFPASELCDALLMISEITISELLSKPEVEDFRHPARSAIRMSIALAIDGVQDEYEAIADTAVGSESEPVLTESGRDLEDIVRDLNAFYRPENSGSDPSRPDSGADAAEVSTGVS